MDNHQLKASEFYCVVQEDIRVLHDGELVDGRISKTLDAVVKRLTCDFKEFSSTGKPAYIGQIVPNTEYERSKLKKREKAHVAAIKNYSPQITAQERDAIFLLLHKIYRAAELSGE